MKEFIQKIIDWVMFLFGKETSKQEPYPEFSDYYWFKVKEHSLAPSDGKVMMIGDSVTEGVLANSQYFPEGVVNRGISGDTTMGVLARLEGLVKEKPRKVFILIGTNNFGWGTQEAADRVFQDILAISHAFYRAGSRVYVQNILPVHTGFTLTQHRDKAQIAKTNLLLAVYARQTKAFTFVDLYSHFVGEDSNMQVHLTTDGLHLTPEGYKLWGEVISPLMD